MGGAPSSPQSPSKFDDPENWRLEHVIQLRSYWLAGNFDFGLEREAFNEFIAGAIPSAASSTPELWRKFDPNNTQIVNALEVMTGLCVMCQSSVKEKAQFLFELNDFNRVGSLSYDELVVLLYVSSSSTVLISGKGVIAEENLIETIADEAFVSSDVDSQGRIEIGLFIEWVTDFLGITEDTPSCGLREFLKRMKSLKPAKLAGPTPGQQAAAESAE